MNVFKARPTKWAVFFIMGIVLMPGCRKPEEDLGLELLPGDPLGFVAETAQLDAFMFQEDSTRTSGLTRNLLGSYLDPLFGSVKAGIVTQLRMSSSNVGFGQDNSGLQADSLVLSLAYDGTSFAYGSLSAQQFEVYELSEDLYVDSLYYTNDVPEVIPEDLVAQRGARITPRPLNWVYVNGDSLAPQLRIRLDQGLAERFINSFGEPQFVDNTTFLEFFKGLYIKVENGQQLPFQDGILYFNLLSNDSKATLYYHNNNDQPELLRTFDMAINTNSVRYTVVEHDHTAALDQTLVASLEDPLASAPTVFVQALGGVRTAIRLPDIMSYAVEGRVLSRAELVVPLQGTFNPYLTPPNQIFLFRRDSLGAEVFLPDQLTGIGTIDGNYRSNDREYRFNITRYIHGVLTGTIPNTGFEMVSGASGISANRVVLAGPDAEGAQMRLLLTFTTY